jgi:hypothetical protein
VFLNGPPCLTILVTKRYKIVVAEAVDRRKHLHNWAFAPVSIACSRLIYCSLRRVLEQQDRRTPWVWLAAALWLGCAGVGLYFVWAYDNAPGLEAHAPETWPEHTSLVRADDRPTLVLLAHPQCDCTRATLGELAEVLARTSAPPKTYVLFLRPTQFQTGWEQTSLWRSARSLPNVTVLRDDDGAEARRFGAETSGQTLLYDERGLLAFSGGITGARGHAGDNAGRASLLALLSRRDGERRGSSVFGCPLFTAGDRS